MHIAHVTSANGMQVQQTVQDHCRKTAEYAAKSLCAIGLDRLGALTGWLHDMGKCKAEMQDYLMAAWRGEKVNRGSVNHTFAGVIYLFERYHQGDCMGFRELTCEIAAYAIGAHHGLFDCVSELAEDGFLYRLMKDRAAIHYEESRDYYLNECLNDTEIDCLFSEAQHQVTAFFEKIMKGRKPTSTERDSYIGFLCRFVLSALMEADRRDTAEFMSQIARTEKICTSEFWESELTFTEKKLAGFPSDSPIAQARKAISDQCANAAVRPTGIYRLTVPTGSGKTLASLRFAQVHAQKYEKSRIFYVIPLLSVIEQNAAVWRQFVRNPSFVLEHHSNVIKSAFGDGDTDRLETFSVSWKSPYVITTLVQLLNALFSGKTDAVSRMNALGNSVIVIDEVQSLPLKTLCLFNLALNFLSGYCGATVVLCSATQPCFDSVKYPLCFAPSPELVPQDPRMIKIFKRTDVAYLDRKGGYGQDEIRELVLEHLKSEGSILVICNTKETAGGLYRALREVLPADIDLFYLSTSLCAQHRRDVLAGIQEALAGKRRTVCVSTQLVEAGVDFSFACVIRMAAGLDHLAQSAGRSNRHGELLPRHGQVLMIPNRDENLRNLQDIALTQTALYEFLSRYRKNPENFQHDMLSEASIALYYHRFWSLPDIAKNFMYPLPKQNTDLVSLLSGNKVFLSRNALLEKRYALHQAFETAGRLFSVFDNDTTDVIVPYNEEAEKIISGIESQKAECDPKYLWEMVRSARPYTVSLYEYQVRALEKQGCITDYADKHIFCLMPNAYDSNALGVITDAIRCEII